ncbi:MAG: hypothetical protein LBI41_01435 [Lactobacillales bacterium]|nr:hypothetical protein [Lactobacillales bacterium]
MLLSKQPSDNTEFVQFLSNYRVTKNSLINYLHNEWLFSSVEIKDRDFKVGEDDKENPIVTKRKEDLKEFCESKGIKVQDLNNFRINLSRLNHAQLVEFCNLHITEGDIWWLKLVVDQMTTEEKLALFEMGDQKDILMAQAEEEYKISVKEASDREIQKIKDWMLNNQAEDVFENLKDVVEKSMIDAISQNDGLGKKVLKAYVCTAALETVFQS